MRRTVLAALALSCLIVSGCLEVDKKPVVAAAASLRSVMPALLEGFGTDMTVTYGGSGALRQQVEGGAPVDLVLFASAEPVDRLIQSGLADSETRRVIGRNTLVLIVPTDSSPQLSFETLTKLTKEDRVAIGDPRAVPAGHYAKQALEDLKIWGSLQDRLVFAGDVTAVLGYVRRGEVAAAVVYETDVLALTDVRIVDRADWKGAPTPQLVGAAVTSSPEARSFLSFLGSPQGAEIMGSFGFHAE